MIVNAKSYGQLGNRLFLYAHMIAAARALNVSLANPCFAEYADLFPSTAGDLWCRYPAAPATNSDSHPTLSQRKLLAKSVYLATKTLSTLRLTRFPFRVIRLRPDEECDLAGAEFSAAAKRRLLLTQGWLFRSDALLNEHSNAIRSHFEILPENRNRVDQLMQRVRVEADVVVGVHIRHGDYATFMNGRYFYSVAQYAAAMHSIAEQFQGKRVGFLVCSNAKADPGEFDGLNIHFGTGHITEDLYALAAADLLIGPPSTYTGWASFYGGAPLLRMESAELPIDLSGLDLTRVGSAEVNRVA